MGFSKFSAKTSVINQFQSPQIQAELIDEHLFVEALSLCALLEENQKINSLSKDESIDSSVETIEKVIMLVERMSNSDGLNKKLKKGDISHSIKCSLLDKKDMVEGFRKKYAWYFNNKYALQ
jgi:hypothetical protein